MYLPCWCHYFVNTTKALQGNDGVPRLQNRKKTNLTNNRKAAAYRTEGSQPNTIRLRKPFQILD